MRGRYPADQAASRISRLTGPATVRSSCAAGRRSPRSPASHLHQCHQRLDALLPGRFGRAESVLEADLASLNAILHPPGWSATRAGSRPPEASLGFYAQGSGPGVARVIDAIDAERLALARALGTRPSPFAELFRQHGFTTGERAHAGGAYHAIQHGELIRRSSHPARPSLPARRRRLGMVPWMHLAAAAATPGPPSPP